MSINKGDVAAELGYAGAQVALQLTPEQKERLLAARTYLLAQMMEIIQERTLIISMLQVCKPDPFCWPSGHAAVRSAPYCEGSWRNNSPHLPDAYPSQAWESGKMRGMTSHEIAEACNEWSALILMPAGLLRGRSCA